MLSSCFFLIGIGFICTKNFRKTFQRLLGRKPRRFCDHTFSGTSQNLSKNVSICFAKMIDIMSADSEKPNTTGVFGRNIAMWQKKYGSGKANFCRTEFNRTAAHTSLALCGRVNQFRSPYSGITMRRSLRKRRVFFFSFQATLTLKNHNYIQAQKN